MAHAVNPRAGIASTHGFTLVETLVALLVIAVAYAGVTTAVGRFVDQRQMLVERHAGHRIAWNRLLEEYRAIHWPSASGQREREGLAETAGGRWHWRLQQDKAQGQGLIRYRVEVFDGNGDDNERVIGSLTAFWVH